LLAAALAKARRNGIANITVLQGGDIEIGPATINWTVYVKAHFFKKLMFKRKESKPLDHWISGNLDNLNQMCMKCRKMVINMRRESCIRPLEFTQGKMKG